MPESTSKAISLLSYWDQGFYDRSLVFNQLIDKTAHQCTVSLNTLTKNSVDKVPELFKSGDKVWALFNEPDLFSLWLNIRWSNEINKWEILSAPLIDPQTLTSETRSLFEQFFIMNSSTDDRSWASVCTYIQALYSNVGLPTLPQEIQLVKASVLSSISRDTKDILTGKLEVSNLMRRYIAMDCPESMPERSIEEVLHENAPFSMMGGWGQGIPSVHTKRILWHLMGLPEEQIQAVEVPVGADINPLISSYASTASLDCLLRGQGPFKVALIVDQAVAANCPSISIERWLDGAPGPWSTLERANRWLDEVPLMALERRFIENAQAKYPKARTLSEVISELRSTLTLERAKVNESTQQAQQVKAIRYRLDRQYESGGGLDAQWKTLQDNDIALEKAYSDLAQASVEWTALCKNGWLNRLGRSLPFTQRQWREKVWNFYEARLKGLIAWDEDAFKQGAQLAEVIHGKLRSIRTERSKLHQKMVPLSESIAQRAGAEKKWLAWQKTALPDFNFGSFADIESAQDPSRIANEVEQQLSKQLNLTALRLGEALCLNARKNESGFKDRLSAIFYLCPVVQCSADQFVEFFPISKNDTSDSVAKQSLMDCLLIQSEAIPFPADNLPLLLRSKRAIFFGDRLHEKCIDALIEGQDTAETVNTGLVLDDMDYDEHRAKGLLLSRASSFLLARCNSAYKKIHNYGLSAQSELMLNECSVSEGIISFLNMTVYNGQLFKQELQTPASFPPICGFHVKGKTEEGPNGISNSREAATVGMWLKKHLHEIKAFERDSIRLKSVCVVTLSKAQKHILQQHVLQNVPVYTVDELPHQAYQWVLFSPVLTDSSRRPFIFDTEPLLLAKIVSLAVQSLMIFSDLNIFDVNSNTPSGSLARTLFSTDHQVLKAEVPSLTASGETLKFGDIQKLKSHIDQLVQKAQSSITIACTELSIKTIEQLRLTGDMNKAIGRKVRVEIIISRKDHLLLEGNKVLNTWKKAGVIITVKDKLFDNLIMIDDFEVYELGFSVLAVKEQDYPLNAVAYYNQDASIVNNVFGLRTVNILESETVPH